MCIGIYIINNYIFHLCFIFKLIDNNAVKSQMPAMNHKIFEKLVAIYQSHIVMVYLYILGR
jgi:hypothetical protein